MKKRRDPHPFFFRSVKKRLSCKLKTTPLYPIGISESSAVLLRQGDNGSTCMHLIGMCV